MTSKTYNMSFTTGSLLPLDTVKLAAIYGEYHNWNAVRDEAIAQNVLQARALNTSKRLIRELISRLKTLSINEIDTLLKLDHQQQCYLLWIAICRRYNFIAEFASQVLREHFISMKPNLSHVDYEIFFNQKAEWHPELEKLSDSTRYKLKQNLFRMMTEAGLLDKNGAINAAMPSRELAAAVSASNKGNLAYLPLIQSSTLDVAT